MTIRYCVEKGIAFVLSRNKKAFSCRDASNKRKRLGHTGIPLCDEFKSIVFSGAGDTQKYKAYFVHCRGNLKIDVQRLMACCKLSCEPVIMPKKELGERFDMELGIVNPFLTQNTPKDEVLHVFDKSLLTSMSFFPGTMMTNAGEHTWGIEFDPRLLINAVENKVISGVACLDGEPQPFWSLDIVHPAYHII
jgi:prolyl-tRNA editing enzyme YbaK/EbsC (Cys-tRNA(Pro) deacylase)